MEPFLQINAMAKESTWNWLCQTKLLGLKTHICLAPTSLSSHSNQLRRKPVMENDSKPSMLNQRDALRSPQLIKLTHFSILETKMTLKADKLIWVKLKGQVDPRPWLTLFSMWRWVQVLIDTQEISKLFYRPSKTSLEDSNLLKTHCNKVLPDRIQRRIGCRWLKVQTVGWNPWRNKRMSSHWMLRGWPILWACATDYKTTFQGLLSMERSCWVQPASTQTASRQSQMSASQNLTRKRWTFSTRASNLVCQSRDATKSKTWAPSTRLRFLNQHTILESIRSQLESLPLIKLAAMVLLKLVALSPPLRKSSLGLCRQHAKTWKLKWPRHSRCIITASKLSIWGRWLTSLLLRTLSLRQECRHHHFVRIIRMQPLSKEVRLPQQATKRRPKLSLRGEARSVAKTLKHWRHSFAKRTSRRTTWSSYGRRNPHGLNAKVSLQSVDWSSITEWRSKTTSALPPIWWRKLPQKSTPSSIPKAGSRLRSQRTDTWTGLMQCGLRKPTLRPTPPTNIANSLTSKCCKRKKSRENFQALCGWTSPAPKRAWNPSDPQFSPNKALRQQAHWRRVKTPKVPKAWLFPTTDDEMSILKNYYFTFN